MTTPAPDLPDWAAGQQPVTVPTIIGSFTILNNGETAFIDVSAFTSIGVIQLGGGDLAVDVQQYLKGSDGIYYQVGSGGQGINNAVMPVLGNAIQVSNFSGSTINIDVVGFGKAGSNAPGIGVGWSGEPSKWALGSTNMVSGTSYPLVQGAGQPPSQGPNYMFCEWSGTTAKGLTYAVTDLGNAQYLCDTAEMAVLSNGERGIFRMVALPANITAIEVLAEATATGSVTVYFTPAY